MSNFHNLFEIKFKGSHSYQNIVFDDDDDDDDDDEGSFILWTYMYIPSTMEFMDC